LSDANIGNKFVTNWY